MTCDDEDQLYVTSKVGAASLVGMGAGLTSAFFAIAFGHGQAVFISMWLAFFCAVLAWVQHRVYGRRR